MSEETEWADGREWWLFYRAPRKTLAPYWAIALAILSGIGGALVMYRLYAGA